MNGPSELSRRTSRGAVTNVAFGFTVDALAIIQGILVPRLIGPENMGLFELATGGVAIGMVLKSVDLPRKVVQERDVDLHTSYAIAFTLELLLAGTFFVLVLGIAPLLAYLYDRPELWLLTTVLAATIFTTAFLELPAAIPYREMRFVRRNVLTSIGPVVTFCVTVPAAYLGAGVWSLVAGTLAGFAAAAVVLLVVSPMRPSLAWDRRVVRRFLSFGWPGWLAALASLAGGWGAVFVLSASLGIAGLAYFELAQSWAARVLQTYAVLSDAVFPALCSMQSSVARLRRAFVTISRLSMVVASPLGFALLTFAQPAVLILLGPKWQPAVLLVQAESAGVIVNSIGYSWHLFFAARGQTKPWLVMSLLGLAWTVVVVIPLLYFFDIHGAAISIIVLVVGSYLLRQYYATRLFGPIRLVWLVKRELVIGVVPAVALGGLHLAGWEPRSFAVLVTQVAVYLVIAGITAVVVSGDLLREVWNAVRSKREPGDELPREVGALVLMPTPRLMAFPLLVGAEADHDRLWVTTRDWPAVGRFDRRSDTWTWFELRPFPHAPTPDGSGGCWTALTRSSAVVHLAADGSQTTIPLPKTRELLVSALDEDMLWVVDAGRTLVHRIHTDTQERVELPLPPGFVRPDFVSVDADHRIWVADTHAPLIAVTVPGSTTFAVFEAPHSTRALVADAVGGMWLGAADQPLLSHADRDGRVTTVAELPGIPFGIDALDDGRIAVVVKDADLLAVVDPAAGSVATVRLPDGSMPMGCAVLHDHCFVTLAGASQIARVALSAIPPMVPAGGLDE